jgi:outer membrane lipoprotein-sorting protein
MRETKDWVENRQRFRRGLTLLIGAGMIFLLRAPVPAEATANPADAVAVFEQMAVAVKAVDNYTARLVYYSSSSGPSPIWARTVAEGKFVHSPVRAYQKVLSNVSNFNEQVKPGTQMIFDGKLNEQLLLLPGVMQMTGVIHLFPEDVKCMDLTGTPRTIHTIWDQVEDWKAKLKTGALALRAEPDQGASYPVLTMTFPTASPGGRAKISRIEIWVDPATHLPRRYRGFVNDNAAAVAEVEYSAVKVNPGLKAEDLDFEGLSLWSFPAQFVANADGLDQLKYEPPARQDGAPPTVEQVQQRLESALAPIKDYRAEFNFTMKYFRLRASGWVTQSLIREPRAFRLEFAPDLRINHLHMLSAGGKVCLRRDERTYAAMGSGALRAAGVQLMHVDDPRSDFPCGESFSNLNLFELLPRLKWYRQNGKVTVDLVKIGSLICPRLIMERTTPPQPGELQDLTVILNPETWLPVRVEYLGNLDPQGYTVIDYQTLKTNLGLKEEDLKF